MNLVRMSRVLCGPLGLLFAQAVLAQCPVMSGGDVPSPGAAASGGPTGAAVPSAPAPAGPSSPAPATPGPAKAAATPAGPVGGPLPNGGVTRPSGGRGIPLVFTHGATTKQLLTIDWDLPVHAAGAESAAAPGGTVAGGRHALPAEEALREIGRQDHRPLLVLRECRICQGTDVALLSRDLGNERTILLTRWFHCVKLPANVGEADHPYHNLFDNHTHLFLCSADGSNRVNLDGMQSQLQLWKVMLGVLAKAYDGSAEDSVKELLALVAKYDVLDDKLVRLQKELDHELDGKGTRSPRIPKLQAEMKALDDDRRELTARQKKLAELPLKGQ